MAKSSSTAGSWTRHAGHPGERPAPAAALPRIVYLLPDGFAAERLVAALRGEGGRLAGLVELEGEPDDVCACFGLGPAGAEARVEVRARSATVVAPSFAVRRDLLVQIMDLVAAAGGAT
ncbi:MAG: hypothetical protein KatS3mg102_2260 [Planctomycetota bacterium]|nr:MAG: hypothetical protein KatS3mg102_2260 [Planctomycetota bacterium]